MFYSCLFLGFIHANEIVIDMLEDHVLLNELLFLAKISQVPQLYEKNRMCLGHSV